MSWYGPQHPNNPKGKATVVMLIDGCAVKLPITVSPHLYRPPGVNISEAFTRVCTVNSFWKYKSDRKKKPQHSTGSYRSKSFYKLLFWGFPQCMLKLCGMSAILSQSVFFHLLPSAYMYCMHIGPLFRQETCNMSSVFTKLALLLMAIVFLCFMFK